MSTKHTPTLRIDDMPLPSRKCIRIYANGEDLLEMKQTTKRVKFYGIKQLQEHEPERVKLLKGIVRACNSHDALVKACEAMLAAVNNYDDEEPALLLIQKALIKAKE